jgi:tetratricopeptide (TPR) repeat protein
MRRGRLDTDGWFSWFGGIGLALCLFFSSADAAPVAVTARQVALEQACDAARAKSESSPADAEAAWQLARACFECAYISTKKSSHLDWAEDGVKASRRALQIQDSAPAHYYLGLNLAEIARVKKLGALAHLRELEREWLAASALDPHFDYAGPDRALGLLYRDAPDPPFSLGNRTKADKHLRHAVSLAPEFPENHLNLIESYLKWNQMESASRETEALRSRLAAARQQFSAPDWNCRWEDWDKRFAKITALLAKKN